MVADEGVKVVLWDVSRHGAGLVSPVPFRIGQTVSMRVGIGPLKCPRPARVVRCTPDQDGTYRVGLVFEDTNVSYLPGTMSDA